MILSHHQQHQLQRIETGLLRSDPQLTAMLGIFGKLSAGQTMPAWEQVPTRRDRIQRAAALTMQAVTLAAAAIGLLLNAVLASRARHRGHRARTGRGLARAAPQRHPPAAPGHAHRCPGRSARAPDPRSGAASARRAAPAIRAAGAGSHPAAPVRLRPAGRDRGAPVRRPNDRRCARRCGHPRRAAARPLARSAPRRRRDRRQHPGFTRRRARRIYVLLTQNPGDRGLPRPPRAALAAAVHAVIVLTNASIRRSSSSLSAAAKP
jgi:hypothetical protein